MLRKFFDMMKRPSKSTKRQEVVDELCKQVEKARTATDAALDAIREHAAKLETAVAHERWVQQVQKSKKDN